MRKSQRCKLSNELQKGEIDFELKADGIYASFDNDNSKTLH